MGSSFFSASIVVGSSTPSDDVCIDKLRKSPLDTVPRLIAGCLLPVAPCWRSDGFRRVSSSWYVSYDILSIMRLIWGKEMRIVSSASLFRHHSSEKSRHTTFVLDTCFRMTLNSPK